MVAQPREALTIDEYFALERASDVRHEYFDGAIVSMVGASLPHNQIQINLAVSLKPQLRRKGCSVLGSDMRVRAGTQHTFCYPDLSVVRGKPELVPFRPDTLVNPIVLIEILSPSTELFDRSRKFSLYRQIPSLREYVLVAQDAPTIEHYLRQDDGTWRLSVVEGLTETITLPTIDCTLALADVYDEVAFPDAEGAER